MPFSTFLCASPTKQLLAQQTQIYWSDISGQQHGICLRGFWIEQAEISEAAATSCPQVKLEVRTTTNPTNLDRHSHNVHGSIHIIYVSISYLLRMMVVPGHSACLAVLPPADHISLPAIQHTFMVTPITGSHVPYTSLWASQLDPGCQSCSVIHTHTKGMCSGLSSHWHHRQKGPEVLIPGPVVVIPPYTHRHRQQ